jgi:aspartate carbamoyltransferase catalytic subunit
MRSLIDIRDLTPEEIDSLVATANDIIANPGAYSEKCRGKKLATLFFEPSTRTRLSFEAAMYELGGNVLGFSEAQSSSAAKGESVADTARTVSCYADIIAMRHPKEGAPLVAAMHASVPVINAGDGGHNHPTQTLADLLTIQREKGGFENLTVGFCGDLKFGRTVHSLIAAMSRYPGLKVVLVSPEELKLPSYVKNDVLKKNGIPYVQTTDLESVIGELDILYMTRVQRERFFSEEEYLRLKDSYILTPEKLRNARAGSVHHAPAAPRERDIHRHRRRPAGLLFQAGAVRKIHAHGAYYDASGGEGMNIDSIQNGIVIDHIPAGKGMELYGLLNLETLDCQVAIIKNALSGKMGRKDIIKIDAAIDVDLDLLGYTAPGATINIIRDGVLAEKKTPDLPETLTGVLKCKNPRCISSTEQELPQIFRLADRGEARLPLLLLRGQGLKNL